jgi:hypothetical protein
MNGLFEKSLEEKLPLEIMYLSNKGEITHRTVIVNDIQEDYIKVFCLSKRQPRIFKRSNILSTAKPRIRKGAIYA